MSCLHYSRRRKRLQSAAGAGIRRTQTSPKSRRANGEMGRKRTTATGSALTSTTALNKTTVLKTLRKTRAVTASETRTKTKDEPKTRRRTERGIGKGKKTRRETKTEKKQEIGILTKTGKETRTNEETETKRESDTKRGKRGTKVERVAIARYAILYHTCLKF